MLFLGHWISKGVIQMDQEKIRSVLDWEVPRKERAGSSGEAGCSKQFSFFLRQDSSGGVESCHNLGGVYIIGSQKT